MVPPSNPGPNDETRTFGAAERRAPRSPGSSEKETPSSDSEAGIDIRRGSVLAQRFRVLGVLGRGGMGEVFEADDLVLGDQVALKVVRGGGLASEGELRRLRREVQLARRVTHRNVCRIFDLIQHRDEQTGAPIDLISMELLPGESLQDLIARRGRLEPQEALPIIRQVARGLNAAHSLDIVHRDLKPANIMLVSESGGWRAAITDFGLAHAIETEATIDGLDAQEVREIETVLETGQTVQPSLFSEESAKHRIVGTPAYMAPEQVTGESTSAATDLYSLGVVIHEMLSGSLPFSGATPWLMAIRRLTVEPTSLQELRPDLDRAVLAVAARCLSRHPADRFASVGELLERLDRGDSGWDVYGRKKSDDPTWSDGRDSAFATKAMPAVPISETDEGSEDIINAVESELATVERESRDGESESSSAPATLEAAETHPEISAETPSPEIAPSQGGKLEAPKFSPLPAPAADEAQRPGRAGPNKRPFAIGLLVALVFAALFFVGRGLFSPADGSTSTATFEDLATSGLSGPGDPAPPEVLAEIDRFLTVYDGARARELIAGAMESSPRDPRLLGRLAEAHWRLGEEVKSREVIENAVDLAGSLSQSERQGLEALRLGLHGSWPEASDLFESLWHSEGKLDFALWALEAHSHSGFRRGRPELIESIRATLPLDSHDLRLDLWAARAARNRVTERERAEELAGALVDAASELGQSYIEFQALSLHHATLRALGQRQEARPVLSALLTLSQELGDRERAEASLMQALHLHTLGFEEESLVEIEKASRLSEALGSDRGRCDSSRIRGAMRALDDDSLIEIFQRSVDACVRGGFRWQEAHGVLDLARSWRDLGNHGQSQDYFEQALGILEELGDRQGMALGRISLAILLGYQGQHAEALDLLAASEEFFRQRKSEQSLLMTLSMASEVALTAGRLENLDAWLEEINALEPVGGRLLELYYLRTSYFFETSRESEFQKAIAGMNEHARILGIEVFEQVAIGYEAKALVSSGRLREGLEKFETMHEADAFGGDIALTHLALGQLDEARSSAATFAEWAHEENIQPALWYSDIVAARLDLASDPGATRKAEIVRRLETIEHEARNGGSLSTALEATLVRALAGDDLALLESVREEAQRLGLIELAHRAVKLPSQ